MKARTTSARRFVGYALLLLLVPFPERSYDFSDAGATGGLSASADETLAAKPPVAPASEKS